VKSSEYTAPPPTDTKGMKARRGIVIRDIPDLRRAVAKVIRQLLTGEIQPDRGRAAIYAMNTLLRTFEVEPIANPGRRFIPFRYVLGIEEVETLPAGERDRLMKTEEAR